MKRKKPYGYPSIPNPRYDFDTFARRVKTLDYEEIITKASAACSGVENASYDRPGAVAAREGGSMEFANRLKELLFFLRHWALPTQGPFNDKGLYKEIAESLVAKGQAKKEVLDLFKTRG